MEDESDRHEGTFAELVGSRVIQRAYITELQRGSSDECCKSAERMDDRVLPVWRLGVSAVSTVCNAEPSFAAYRPCAAAFAGSLAWPTCFESHIASQGRRRSAAPIVG